MNYSDYGTLIKTTRYWLTGKAASDSRYYITLKALNIALSYHTGYRKDLVTPEMYHQLAIFSYLRNLSPLMMEPHLVLGVTLLHDTLEDYPESLEELERKVPELLPYIRRINKKDDRGQKLSYHEYFDNMKRCPVTSIVKAGDRIHNLSTMHGAFDIEKQKSYIQDVHDYFYGMLKFARREFPEQENIYENLKSVLSMLTMNISQRIGEK